MRTIIGFLVFVRALSWTPPSRRISKLQSMRRPLLFGEEFSRQGISIKSIRDRSDDIPGNIWHGTPEWLVRKMRELGFESPSRVQSIALPILFNGSDAVIQAETGSGKTLLYLLPLLARLDLERTTTQAVVIVPTRELGLQVANVAKKLCAGYTGNAGNRVLVMSLLEGSQNRRQRAWAWAEPPHLVIAQPTVLNTMLATKGLRSRDIRYVVVDEVDACYDTSDGSLHQILSRHLSQSFDDTAVEEGKLLPCVENKATQRMPIPPRQTVFLSASIPQPRIFIRQCVQRRWCAEEPKWLHVRGAGQAAFQLTPSQVNHAVHFVETSKKLRALRTYVRKEVRSGRLERAIIFLNADRPLEEIAAVLNKDILLLEGENIIDESEKIFVHTKEESREEDTLASGRVAVLHEDAGLNGRSSVVSEFRSGKLRLLVATDLAARGIDVPETSHVVQFDMPKNMESYLHRAGRTGRMGRRGYVLTLATPAEDFVVTRLSNSLSIDFEVLE